MNAWAAFPHDNSAYDYSADDLKNHWDQLHQGDRVLWPDEACFSEYDMDITEAQANLLVQAWQAFHRGDFYQAVSLADEAGICGHAVANKATGIYADYLEEDEAQQQSLYQSIVERAEQAIEALPKDPNSYYFHAYGLGRYSQSISITKALSQGLGTKVRNSLETTLELNPEHAEAQLAMGLFHAEIINKVGKLVGGMTYGANADTAIAHFQQATALAPGLPIIHIEYGNGLYLLYGDKRMQDMTQSYETAVAIEPQDAMQRLDRDFAVDELAE
ncbi:MAG: hypothetical protein MI750_15555 [Xanthomonadales bacterium]|jgi:tetratricopeptide (TPR) repeat protein|nr:hypothetical protein [Xanthomonadales bacterium]